MKNHINISNSVIRSLFITVGFTMVYFGSLNYAHAAFGNGHIIVDDSRLIEVLRAILAYLEGSFGALIMVGAGVFAILSAAFGQYRAALGLLIVAIGSFTLRSFISTFFNIQELNN
jgi:hypothetical protein